MIKMNQKHFDGLNVEIRISMKGKHAYNLYFLV